MCKQERKGRRGEEQTILDKEGFFIIRPKPTSEEQPAMCRTERGGVEHETGQQHFYLEKSKDNCLI